MRNKNSDNTDSSLAPASKSRSLPFNEQPRTSSGTGLQGGWGLGICIIIIVDFLVCLLLKNKNSVNTDSSLASASKYRSLPSNEHPRIPSGRGVQGDSGLVICIIIIVNLLVCLLLKKKTQLTRTTVMLLLVNLDHSPLMNTLKHSRVQGYKGLGGWVYVLLL